MNSMVLLAVLSGGICLASAQTAPPISGKWKVHTVMVQESDVTCVVTQKSVDLNGACAGEHVKFHIVGKIKDEQISWSYKTEYNGELLTVSYDGALESDSKITGTARVSKILLEGDFVATKEQ